MNIALSPIRLEANASEMTSKLPLVVDLDGTLVRSDLLHESFFDVASRRAHQLLSREILFNFSKERVKAHLADLSQIDYSALPYNEAVLQLISDAKSEGRAVYLATASDRKHAEAIADHLAGC